MAFSTRSRRLQQLVPTHGLLWGLLADDLTGACDAGVQFAEQGFSTVVRLDNRFAGSEQVDLIVQSSESRCDGPDVARQKVHQVCKQFAHERRTIVYKKVDSTLRGNLGQEIEAAMAGYGFSLAIVAPAFPALGRTLEAGWLRQTGPAPAPSAHLPTLLAAQGVKGVVHFNLIALRSGLRSLTRKLRGVATSQPKVIILDAISQEDLNLVAQAGLQLEPPPLMVGSAGLAKALAVILSTKHPRKDLHPLNDATGSRKAGPVVMFIGSTSPVTASQVEYLLSCRQVTPFTLGREEAVDTARQALEQGRHLMIKVDLTEDNQRRVSQFCILLSKLPVRGLILSGGDTAHFVCRALEGVAIRLEREIVPGLPLGWLTRGAGDKTPLATKAGGFGESEALANAFDFLACTEDR